MLAGERVDDVLPQRHQILVVERGQDRGGHRGAFTGDAALGRSGQPQVRVYQAAAGTYHVVGHRGPRNRIPVHPRTVSWCSRQASQTAPGHWASTSSRSATGASWMLATVTAP